VCPYVRHLGEIPENLNPNAPMLEPTLFRSNPTKNLVDALGEILSTHGGKVYALLNEEYYPYSKKAI
jgi:hypothetical protein